MTNGKPRFDFGLAINLETEVRATNALLALCFAQLTMDSADSICDPSISGAYAAGIADLIHRQSRHLSEADDAVAREAHRINGIERSAE